MLSLCHQQSGTVLGDLRVSNHLKYDRSGLHDRGEANHGSEYVGNDAQSTADGRDQPASPTTTYRACDRVDYPGARDGGHDERPQQELDGLAREASTS